MILLPRVPRAGLFLPQLDRHIDELRGFSGASEKDKAREWPVAARLSDWTFGSFRGLGVKGFQHLRQLLGANTVAPTREIAGSLKESGQWSSAEGPGVEKGRGRED